MMDVSASRAAQQLSSQCFHDVTSAPYELRVKLPAACSTAMPPAPVCRAEGVYSPIQRLVDQQRAAEALAPLANLAKCGSLSCGKAAAVSLMLDTDSSQATRLGISVPFDTPSLGNSPFNDDDDVGPSLRAAEHIGESAGAAGDEYRFRYDLVSPEVCYSPIAGVHAPHRSTQLDRQHVWSTHIDDDGAVCSQPIPGPLKLTVILPCESSCRVQVVDGMTVSNLKDKLWNLTGLLPLQQRLILPNGAELSDNMGFVGCGLQPGDSLALRPR